MRADEQERLLARLRTAHRVAGVGAWEADLDERGRSTTFHLSAEVDEIAGWTGQQPRTYGDFVGLIHPDDRPGFFEVGDAALAGTRPYRTDLRLVRPNGDVRHVHLAAEVHRRSDGTPERLVGVIQDRTEEIESLRRVRIAEASRRHLLQRLLEAADHERERLARHLEAGAVERLRTAEAAMAEAIGDDAPAPWQEALAGVRRSISSLLGTLSAMSTAPAGTDLAAVVADLAADAAGELVVRIHVQVGVLRPALRSVVVRLVQEGLQNARKHAAARFAEVRVDDDGDHVHVLISDDGRGFDPAAMRPQRGHFGIASLRDDVAAVDGELHISSGPDGTVLEARLPLR